MLIDELLRDYPRVRPALTEKHKLVYEKEYKLNRDGLSPIEWLAKKLESWMHYRLAKKSSFRTLEIGAGTLNHLRFEKFIADYDIVEPFQNLYIDSENLDSVRNIYNELIEIPATARYQRIISCAVLEHMTDLPGEVARAALLLEKRGVFQSGIPSEGGFLWGLAWRSTTAISYWWRNKISYGTVMRHEHVNTANEIIKIIKYFYNDVQVSRFPMKGLHFSLYTYVVAQNPNLERCKDFLQNRNN